MWEFCLKDIWCNKLDLLYLVLFISTAFSYQKFDIDKRNCIVLQKRVTVTIVFRFYEGFDKKQSQSFWGGYYFDLSLSREYSLDRKYIQGNSKYSALLEFIFQNYELPHLLNLWSESMKDNGALYTEKADASSQTLFHVQPSLPHEQTSMKVLVIIFSKSVYKALAF